MDTDVLLLYRKEEGICSRITACCQIIPQESEGTLMYCVRIFHPYHRLDAQTLIYVSLHRFRKRWTTSHRSCPGNSFPCATGWKSQALTDSVGSCDSTNEFCIIPVFYNQWKMAFSVEASALLHNTPFFCRLPCLGPFACSSHGPFHSTGKTWRTPTDKTSHHDRRETPSPPARRLRGVAKHRKHARGPKTELLPIRTETGLFGTRLLLIKQATSKQFWNR